MTKHQKNLIAVVVAYAATVAPIAIGAAHADETLAKKNACTACHAVDDKVLGPSFKEVARKYTGKTSEEALAASIKKGGVGTWGQVPMPPQAQLTDAESKTLARWILAMAK